MDTLNLKKSYFAFLQRLDFKCRKTWELGPLTHTVLDYHKYNPNICSSPPASGPFALVYFCIVAHLLNNKTSQVSMLFIHIVMSCEDDKPWHCY
jgi:hypothetical protein